MSAMASQIISLTSVYSTVYSGVNPRKTSKLGVTGLCVGNSSVTGEFPAQRARNAKKSFHLMTSPCFRIAPMSVLSSPLVYSWATNQHGRDCRPDAKDIANNKPYRQHVGEASHHDDVIKWKYFPRYWPFVRGIHKGQWRGALMFSLIYAWIKDWVNNREAGDFRRQRGHYDVIVMFRTFSHLQLEQDVTFKQFLSIPLHVCTFEFRYNAVQYNMRSQG